jgi:hypothetical protein
MLDNSVIMQICIVLYSSTLIGTPIPFVDFDCSTLDEFLRRYFTHRVIFRQDIDGTTIYELIITDTIAHIAQMVDATKCKSNRKSRSKRSKSVQYRTTANNANRLPPTTDRNHQQTVIEAPSSVTNTIIEEVAFSEIMLFLPM